MLNLYLHAYNKNDLTNLAKSCSDCFGLDWQTRIQSESLQLQNVLTSLQKSELPALFILEEFSTTGSKVEKGREVSTTGSTVEKGKSSENVEIIENIEQSELNAVVKNIRTKNAMHYLLLQIANSQQALNPRPAYYRTTGFLLQPLNVNVLRGHLNFIYEDFMDVNMQYGGFLSFKAAGTVYKIAYSKIIFFESHGKKVKARTSTQEFEFYESLENVGKAAPNFFIQVHRSIYVNVDEIDTIDLQKKDIAMKDGSVIPFTKTFRDNLLAAVSNKEGE
ncbi:MAG: LytTR family transcriptional regulator [Firmicutes bacterium]|nr:LytTR family transcriptional regulator [Bacillota bacterium]